MSTSYKSSAILFPAQDLLNCLEHTARQIDNRHQQSNTVDYIADTIQDLETLPLTTEEYAVTRNRLQNIASYLGQGEWGAAHYEIQLACGWLRAFIHRYEVSSAVA